MEFQIDNIKIRLCDKILRDLNSIYINNQMFETGGILLGKFTKSLDSIDICEVYEIKTGLFSRIYYKRNVKKAQRIIDARWKESNGEINYLGEWHTHPNMRALASSTDFNSLKNLLYKVGYEIPCIIMLILGEDQETNLVIAKGDKLNAFIFNR